VASPVVPAINCIIYASLLDPKARVPPRTVTMHSPVHNGKTTSLMQELHGLQLNLARERQSTARSVRNLKEVIVDKDDCINKKDECIGVLTDCITGKEDRIQVLDNQVQAIEAQVTLLQLRNIFLSEEAENKKKSDKQQENSSRYKWLDNYVGGRGKWKRIAWELFSLSCVRNHLIDETVTHIRDNAYTPTSLAYVTDIHHGLNLTGIDNMHKIEYAKKHSSKLL
jgi:ABC-type phosphate/phosphonate transport system ATPase subunit